MIYRSNQHERKKLQFEQPSYRALEGAWTRLEARELRVVDQLGSVMLKLSTPKEGRGGVMYTTLQEQLVSAEGQSRMLFKELHSSKMIISDMKREREGQSKGLKAEFTLLHTRTERPGETMEVEHAPRSTAAVGTTHVNAVGTHSSLPHLRPQAPIAMVTCAAGTSTSACMLFLSLGQLPLLFSGAEERLQPVNIGVGKTGLLQSNSQSFRNSSFTNGGRVLRSR